MCTSWKPFHEQSQETSVTPGPHPPTNWSDPTPACTSSSPLTSKNLEDPSEVKSAPFGDGEELVEEQEEGQHTEDDGQDHGGLDRLQPFWREETRG